MWEAVQEVQFSDLLDQITWKWTANGLYSSKSAYDIQFLGSYCTFDARALWKTKAEGTHRFFAWLLVQEKIQTADNLLLKGIQCDPMCCLCDQDLESASHLCLHCCFAQQVCFLVHAWSQGLISLPAPDVTVQDWWNLSLQAANAADKGSVAALLIYSAWNIWNERNMCIFQGISQEPQRILGLTKQEMAIREQACEPRGHILIL